MRSRSGLANRQCRLVQTELYVPGNPGRQEDDKDREKKAEPIGGDDSVKSEHRARCADPVELSSTRRCRPVGCQTLAQRPSRCLAISGASMAGRRSGTNGQGRERGIGKRLGRSWQPPSESRRRHVVAASVARAMSAIEGAAMGGPVPTARVGNTRHGNRTPSPGITERATHNSRRGSASRLPLR
jgi:hypothetical protein